MDFRHSLRWKFKKSHHLPKPSFWSTCLQGETVQWTGENPPRHPGLWGRKGLACLVPLPQCRCLSEMWPPEEHLDMEASPQPYCSELRDKGETQPAPVPGWWTHSDLLLRAFTAASCPSASPSLLLTARGECWGAGTLGGPAGQLTAGHKCPRPSHSSPFPRSTAVKVLRTFRKLANLVPTFSS